MMDNITPNPNYRKWFVITSSGVIILSYLAIILHLPHLIDYDWSVTGVHPIVVAIVTLIWEPFFFGFAIFIYYKENFHLILWQLWLIPWTFFLYQIHKNNEKWRQQIQIISYMILIIIVLIISVVLQVFVITDDIVFKLATQVYWIVPLWLIAWLYGWIIEIPHTIIHLKRINVRQALWVCFFAILSIIAVYYLGSFMIERFNIII
jgi:hypothetical protein